MSSVMNGMNGWSSRSEASNRVTKLLTRELGGRDVSILLKIQAGLSQLDVPIAKVSPKKIVDAVGCMIKTVALTGTRPLVLQQG